MFGELTVTLHELLFTAAQFDSGENGLYAPFSKISTALLLDPKITIIKIINVTKVIMVVFEKKN